MRILVLLIVCSFMIFFIPQTESPHGKGFKISCKTCHSPKSWKLDKGIYSFDHNSAKFSLTGQHQTVDCRLCHISLVFSAAKERCNDCHKDIHQTTVGQECSRCHTPESWLVTNITDIHNISRFPLLGAHKTADCIQCHKSESLLRFDVVGVNCIDCHRENYLATTNPNHVQAGYPENCSQCHAVNAFEWTGAGFTHTSFSLAQGHSGISCKDCHKTGSYSDANPECYSCHSQAFEATKNPDHKGSGFSTICQECHSLSPGWRPVSFNHTSFPLTNAHSGPACIDCHKGNYTTLSKECYSCHAANYNNTLNPNHKTLGFPVTCNQCHTTNPGWKPASFSHTKFPLTLGHSTPACIDCHTGGNYTTTPTDCYSCHQTDFNNTVNPVHKNLGFSTLCSTCHTTNPGWKPASYTLHDSQSFPIYSGIHRGRWNSCTDCHTNTSNYSVFTCTTACHSKAETDNQHSGNNSYSYLSTACYQCHPRGSSN